MRTLKYHPKIEKRMRIALETINIYVPIAERL
jgi:(p)ppGpp synthase/HD superfamily hydrolase